MIMMRHRYTERLPSATVWFSDAVKVSGSKYYVEAYPDAHKSTGMAYFFDLFDADVFADLWRIIYIIHLHQKRMAASLILLHSNLSMSAIDKFLSLQLIGLFLANQRTKLRLWS